MPSWLLWGVAIVVVLTVIYDLVQRKHAILRNFPIIGHFRYWLETIGPELRQYIVTNNDEERPFSRDQRSWVYASAKRQNNYFGFGTDNDLENDPSTLIIKHAAFPVSNPTAGDPNYDPEYRLPVAKVLGGPRGRAKAFRPASVVNVGGMSFGSLSSAAVSALNRGSAIAGCLHNTGEGGVSPYHEEGGDLIWQIGTGYFGCRNNDGTFSLAKLKETCERTSVKAIEIKLSQGAKPGLGGVLPAAKITPEISRIRGIPMGIDCKSPSSHSAFSGVDELLDFVEKVADATGLPVGIKSAVGQLDFWHALAEAMESGQRGVDFVAIDGGEGGTGAAPLVFSDHVALPFKLGCAEVVRALATRGVHERVVIFGSGRLGFPQSGLLAFALGCDAIHVAREAMLAIGCIQAQRCHTGHCPTGVATQNKWLVRGLDPEDKSHRMANYVMTLRKEILALCNACGVHHPAQIGDRHLEMIDDRFGRRSVHEVFGLREEWVTPSDEDLAHVLSK